MFGIKNCIADGTSMYVYARLCHFHLPEFLQLGHNLVISFRIAEFCDVRASTCLVRSFKPQISGGRQACPSCGKPTVVSMRISKLLASIAGPRPLTQVISAISDQWHFCNGSLTAISAATELDICYLKHTSVSSCAATLCLSSLHITIPPLLPVMLMQAS